MKYSAKTSFVQNYDARASFERPRAAMTCGYHDEPDHEIAVRAAKLWPNREHESSAALGLLCRIGIHRWRHLDLAELIPGKDIKHCFWCSKLKVDGVIFDV